jgi:hypothetical protein
MSPDRHLHIMSSITVAVEDEILQQAQKVAAHKHTTVEALVRDFLEAVGQNQRTSTEDAYAHARRDILRMIGSFDVKIGVIPTRERTYGDRH